MKVYIVKVNGEIFKAFVKGEDTEKYYKKLSDIADRKLIRHLSSYTGRIDVISIPVDEDSSNFDMALHRTIHASAGSFVMEYEYESFPLFV